MNVAERSSWIDIARGIGILLVMYGHVFSSSSNKYLIYGFHLPLFFFLSGVVFSYDSAKPFWVFVKKTAKQTLLPYIVYGIATFVFWLVFLHPENATIQLVTQQTEKFILGRVIDGYALFNVPLWFLPCLFVTRVMYGTILRFTNRTTILVSLLGVSSFIGWMIGSYFPHEKYPFSLEVALSAVVFLGVGYLWNTKQPTISLSQISKILLLPILVILYWILTTIHFKLSGSHIDMRVNELHNYFLFYINAFVAIGATLIVSGLLKKNQLLEYLGRNTLVLFVWHYPLYMYFTYFLGKTFEPETVEALKIFNPVGYTLSALVIILGVKRGGAYLRKLAKEQSIFVIASSAKQSS